MFCVMSVSFVEMSQRVYNVQDGMSGLFLGTIIVLKVSRH